MKDIAIFGVGGLGREIQVLIEQINLEKKTFNFIGWFDDGEVLGTKVNNHPVLGGISELNCYKNDLCLAMGLGQPFVKKKVVESIQNSKVSFPVLCHPSVNLQSFQQIQVGRGCLIQRGAILTTNIILGDFVFLNLNSTIGHDSRIDHFSSVMPGAHISGECKIGSSCYFGTNASVINGIEIKDGAVIGAGACVTRNIEPNTVNVGVPAKAVRTLENNF